MLCFSRLFDGVSLVSCCRNMFFSSRNLLELEERLDATDAGERGTVPAGSHLLQQNQKVMSGV